MSLESLIAVIGEVNTEETDTDQNADDETYISLAPNEVVAEEAAEATQEAPEAVVLGKKKGRPGIHSKEGRVYFLKDEVEKIRQDPGVFVEWMKNTYTPSDERLNETASGNIDVYSDEIAYTLHGPILEVLKRAEEIALLYPNKEVSFEISKQKLVAPTNNLYSKPTMETVEVNGKKYESITFQEFSPHTIYVYLTIV